LNRDIQQHFDRVLDGALEFLAYIIKPDGVLPLLGDTRAVRPSEGLGLRELGHLHHYAAFLYSASQGRRGAAPESADRVFPESGYAIFRDRWPSADDFGSAIYVVFKAAFLGRFHRHGDDLSVLLYAFGEDWLVDSGLFLYHEEDARRKYVRSVHGHNLVTVDELEPSRRAADIGRSHIDTWSLQPDCAIVSGSHELYAEISISRRLEFQRSGRLRIDDSVMPADGANHHFRVLFHVPDDKHVTVVNGDALVSSPRTGRRLRLAPLACQFEDVHVVSGRTEPSWQGWSSPEYGTIEKTKCIMFETRRRCLESCVELAFE
jgi:hypothetical protein